MKRIGLFLATTLLAMPALAAQGDIIQSPAYKECIALSSTNPTQALAKAEEWLAIDNGVAAYHCRAMALYGLGRFAEAGDALNAVRRIIPPENITLRTFVTKQSESAWLNANRVDAALAILDVQINEMGQSHGNNVLVAKLTSSLLLERARLNITYGKLSLATQDLDHAVSLTPLNAEVLIERAHAFELLGDASLARNDAEAALTLNPNNPKARALLARLDEKNAPKAAVIAPAAHVPVTAPVALTPQARPVSMAPQVHTPQTAAYIAPVPRMTATAAPVAGADGAAPADND